MQVENKAKQFVAACRAGLQPKLAPIGVEIWVTDSDAQTACIEAIWSHQERKKGHSSNALQQLCALADAMDVSLTATVHPLYYGELEGESEADAMRCESLDGQAMDAQALESWYEKLGFCRKASADEWNPTMVRPANPAV